MDRYRRRYILSFSCAYSPEGELTTCSHMHVAEAGGVIRGIIPSGGPCTLSYRPPDPLQVYPAGAGISHAQ